MQEAAQDCHALPPHRLRVRSGVQHVQWLPPAQKVRRSGDSVISSPNHSDMVEEHIRLRHYPPF
jgi:hypothetical protein